MNMLENYYYLFLFNYSNKDRKKVFKKINK